MKFMPSLVVVFVLLAISATSAGNTCTTPPADDKITGSFMEKSIPCAFTQAKTLMLNVLKPTSRILVDCAGDVIIAYKANATLLRKVVQVVCEYHEDCHGAVAGIQGRKLRRGIARECMLKKFLAVYPAFAVKGGTDGMWIVKKMLDCFCNNQELEFENDDVTNAVMHWIYEVLRTDA